MSRVNHRYSHFVIGIDEQATVSGTLAEVAEIDVRDIDQIMVEVQVTTNPLTQFAIDTKNPNGTQLTLFSTAGDFTSPSGLLVGTSGDLTTQGVGSGHFILDVKPLDKIYINAASTLGATVALKGGGK